jgi:O-antigen/teichoic acid export membrane protein
MKDLKQKAVRSGVAKLIGQALNFILRIAFLTIMARLLNPEDFGLVAMVAAVTGVYSVFSTGGLSYATIQKATITDEQISTLFWINLLIGALLACLCLATAPVLVTFFKEPRLFWITVTTAAGFIFNAAAVQHTALLQRGLRFVAITVVEILSQLAGVVVGIGMAVAGFGYWALVASTIVQPAIALICVWVITPWVPGLPRCNVGISSMLRFGGTVTLNYLVVYVAYNLDKILVGRFWGANILGLYGRAYQLINIPTQSLNLAIGGVAFSALSRLQDDPPRLRSYFLKGYSLANSLTLPTTMFCALFADDIILVALGPKWIDAISIFRFLTPTVLTFGIINPMGWLLQSTGLQMRSLKIAFVIAPLTIAAYFIGLPYGANGVAFAFSVAMVFWLIPHILWCLHGTNISPRDILLAIRKPLLSALFAAAVAFAVQFYFVHLQSPYLRLGMEGGIMFTFYFGMLLFIMGEKELYLNLIRGLRTSS